jgi:hypothetical protein
MLGGTVEMGAVLGRTKKKPFNWVAFLTKLNTEWDNAQQEDKTWQGMVDEGHLVHKAADQIFNGQCECVMMMRGFFAGSLLFGSLLALGSCSLWSK